jgi:hypothetical protein
MTKPWRRRMRITSSTLRRGIRLSGNLNLKQLGVVRECYRRWFQIQPNSPSPQLPCPPRRRTPAIRDTRLKKTASQGRTRSQRGRSWGHYSAGMRGRMRGKARRIQFRSALFFSVAHFSSAVTISDMCERTSHRSCIEKRRPKRMNRADQLTFNG